MVVDSILVASLFLIGAELTNQKLLPSEAGGFQSVGWQRQITTHRIENKKFRGEKFFLLVSQQSLHEETFPETILKVSSLSKYFGVSKGLGEFLSGKSRKYIRAVDNISWTIEADSR